MKYKCENTECETFNIEVPIYKEKIIYRNGVSIASEQPCPKCGKLRTPINPEGMTTYMKGIDGPKK